MAQYVSGIDDTVLFIIIGLLIAIAVVLFLRARKGRRAREQYAWKQKIGDLPPVKTEPSPAFPPRSVPGRDAVADIDLTENSDNLQDSLRILAAKYSLDAITIATADGLVFASNGRDTAQADAAQFNRSAAGKDPAGMTIFGLNHKGSELTVIIRSPAEISPVVRTQIENDTKDILNWWI